MKRINNKNNFKMIIGMALLSVLIFVISFFVFTPQLGARNTKSGIKIISSNFYDGKFHNKKEINMKMSGKEMIKLFKEFSSKKILRSPNQPIPNININRHKTTNSISFIWFGHSTVLMQTPSYNILFDPVFSKRASVFQFVGPEKFPFENEYSIDSLPQIDAIVISHDHYDHLDYNTIMNFHSKVSKFIVPLGVEQHLLHWGVDANKIITLDWWEDTIINNHIRLTSTPAQHFSGRKVIDKDETLWCSWVVQTPDVSMFFSGDSGYNEDFKVIGEKLGPFDYTFIECGQYNERWAQIHMMPEESVKAHIDLKGKRMIPIHWSKFSLSLHSWTEPIERAWTEAEKNNILLLTPQIGELIDDSYISCKWWENDVYVENLNNNKTQYPDKL